VCYNEGATQVNKHASKVYIFTMVKMYALFRIPFLRIGITCVAAIGAMHFSCVASAAHFLFLLGGQYEKNKCAFPDVMHRDRMRVVCGMRFRQFDRYSRSYFFDVEYYNAGNLRDSRDAKPDVFCLRFC
jgi:hypothetical protein